jgi:hypothetical protein
VSRWDLGKKKRKGSYVVEMLKHKYNVYAVLGTVAGAAVLSIPFGLGIALIPVLGYAAGTSIAGLFVPGSRKFRDNIDRRRRAEERELTRKHLVDEISQRVGPNHGYWRDYARICDRRDSLMKIAEQRESALAYEDVERLDDSTLDFLGLWLGRIAIEDRQRAVSEEQIQGRIAQIQQDLEEMVDPMNQRRLVKAKSDLESLLVRRREMRTRDAAAEAAMLSMCDAFDEVYQRIMVNPSSREAIDGDLRSAVERLNIEEELDVVLHEEVDAMLKGEIS